MEGPALNPRGSLALRHRDLLGLQLPEPEPTDVCPLNPPRCGSLVRSPRGLMQFPSGMLPPVAASFPPQECELLLQFGIIPQCVCLGLS